MARLKEEVEHYKKEAAELRLEKELWTDYISMKKGKAILEEQRPLKEEKGDIQRKELANVLYKETVLKAVTEESTEHQGPKLVKNMLYNMNIEFEIPDIPRFKVHAILDTGATTCCIDEDSVPSEALEQNSVVVHFSGINSRQTATKRLKGGKMHIGDNTFRIPYTYGFKMTLGDNIQMII